MSDDWLEVHPRIVRDVFGTCLVDAFLVLVLILKYRHIDADTRGSVACRRSFEVMCTKQLDRRFDDSWPRLVSSRSAGSPLRAQ
jgi:hypothetical protein